MSDDKNKTDPPKTDGTGSDPAKTGTPTTVGFGELFGYIDERIKTALGKSDKTTDGTKTDSGTPGTGDPQSVRDQLRAELAKLQGEEAAAKKEADRDVTIAELKATVDKLSEAAPEEHISKLTEIMWGKKTKKT